MLAVPRMRQLVSEQIAPRSILVPFGEVARAVHVLAGTVVLETDAAEVLGERQQKVVTIERARAVERVRFFHQFAVCRELLRLDFELRRIVRDYIDIHRDVGGGIEINALIMPAGEQQRVDQRVE